jgi:prephenate dehydrogenase
VPPADRFDRIVIVGVGLIGASIALAARRADASTFIVGVDSAEAIRRALERGVVDVGSERLDVAADADLVVLAAPVLQNIRLIPQVAEHVSERTVVTDVGSTKRATVEAARALAGSITFVGGHPLAGAAAGGIEHARVDLFAGRRWVFTPDANAPAAALDRLFAFARSLGATPQTVGAAEHDLAMAFVSHLPQLTASALMRAAADGAGEAGIELSGQGLADTTRLADSPFGIWADICATNEDNIRAALDLLIAELAGARAGLADPGCLADLFEQARRGRSRLRSARRP